MNATAKKRWLSNRTVRVTKPVDQEHKCICMNFRLENYLLINMLILRLCVFFFLKILFVYLFIYLFIERGKGGRKRGRETSMCGCLLSTSYWGPGPQPRHAPWLGIELVTLCFVVQCSIHWATPARARFEILQYETWKFFNAMRKGVI